MHAHRVNGRGTAGATGHTEPPAGSSVSVRVRRPGRWRMVEVEGEMDVAALPLVADLVGDDASRVVFELHGVTFMDARGLGMMVDMHRRALDAGGCVRLVAPSDSVRRVLRLTGCDRMFETFDSLHQAVAAPLR